MSNPLTFLPSLGMSGFYTLAEPYASLISATTQYRCEGVKSLSAAVAEGMDPLNSVYLANGDTKESFQSDLSLGISLVTLSSSTGSLVVFPSKALLKVPDGAGVIYRNTVLSIALSALPESQDMTVLRNEIQELVRSQFGIRAATYLTTVGAAALLSQTQHEAVQAARQAQIETNESLITTNLKLQADLTQARSRLSVLEAYVLANLPPV